MGQVLICTFFRHLAVAVFLNLGLEVFREGFFWQEGQVLWQSPRGSSVSILSSLSSSTMTSESRCSGPSLAIEMSPTFTAFQPWGRRTQLGVSSGRGASPLVHLPPPTTQSSQDRGRDWVTSIASLKAICGASVFFDVSPHGGQEGVGSFQPQELDESQGDPTPWGLA